jgi:hypothetical protein
MNRDELLAKCPKLAEMRDERASAIEADSFEHGGLVPREESNADFDAALDEVLALVNRIEPKPEPSKLAGIVIIDARVLCAFSAARGAKRGDSRYLTELAELPWDWEFLGCEFSPSGMKHLKCAFDGRLPMTLRWATGAVDALHSAEVGLHKWDSEWEKPGAAVSLRLVGPRDAFELTGFVRSAEKSE